MSPDVPRGPLPRSAARARCGSDFFLSDQDLGGAKRRCPCENIVGFDLVEPRISIAVLPEERRSERPEVTGQLERERAGQLFHVVLVPVFIAERELPYEFDVEVVGAAVAAPLEQEQV